MITRRHWETTSGRGMLQVRKFWKGYFLFGIIPLYVAMWRYEEYGRVVNCGD